MDINRQTGNSVPKVLTDESARRRARRIRDTQWSVLERIAEHNPLYICWWDKNGRHGGADGALGLLSCSLVVGMELVHWLKAHPGWTVIGEWAAEMSAAPVFITSEGRDALVNRALYDLEPVEGGLVEPGWQAIPWLDAG